MYTIQCKIENEIDTQRSIIFDVSDVLQEFQKNMMLLTENIIKGFYLQDRENNQIFLFKSGKSDLSFSKQLEASDNTIEILNKMINDCLCGNAFDGYHFDYETANGIGVTFVFKRA